MTPFQRWELFTGTVNNIWVLDGNRRKELTLHIKFGFFTEALINNDPLYNYWNQVTAASPLCPPYL